MQLAYRPSTPPSPAPQKSLHRHCFRFILGSTVVPREIEDNGYVKLEGGGGGDKVHYGLSEGKWSIRQNNISF